MRVFEVADALGAMERVMELTAEHLRNRKQFGQPLAAFQALQHRMSEMFVEVQESRSALYHALAHFDRGTGAAQCRRLVGQGRRDRRRAASSARRASSCTAASA